MTTRVELPIIHSFTMMYEKPFWVIEPNGEGRPARELILTMDNVPYHKGI